MSDKNHFPEFMVGGIIGIMATLAILLCFGLAPEQINKKWRSEIIKNGAGHWTVTDDGKPEFKWGPK